MIPLKLNGNQKSVVLNIKDDALENTEHIGEDSDKIEHQREYFKDVKWKYVHQDKMYGY